MPFKKIFKPIAKVLDKVIPNEIKPALPYLAAFAPVFGPTAGMFGNTMMKRALLSGGANILGQLSQEGSEGDINLLSAGLGALTGAMTTPGAAETFKGMQTFDGRTIADIGEGTIAGKATGLEKLKNIGLEGLAKGSDILRPEGGIPDLFSKAGAKAATIPAATATGDVMQAQARQLEKQNAIDAALAEAEAIADSGLRGDAIRNAMRSYGFFTDDEIEETVSSAGYKAGGRVGFRFGGIDEAIEMVEEKTIEEGKEGIMQASGEDPLLLEEYNKYVFDLMEQRPNAKPMSFQEFKRMIKAGMKEGGRVGLREGGGLLQELTETVQTPATQNAPMFLGNFNPGLGGRMPVFPRLNQLEQGVDRAEGSLNRINQRLGDTQRQLPGLAGIQPFGLRPAFQPLNMARLPLQLQAARLDASQGMKDGGLMDLNGKEMDLRKGGFVPIGKKEQADDVPARLSKNEFVMTADAVRAAGGGSVNKGAKRMYNLMNTLEARA